MMFNRARETRDASGRFFRAETVGNQPLPRPENPAQPACKQSITHTLRTAFGLTEHQVPVSVSAIGAIGEPEQLPDTLREREVAPRSRMDLDDLILLND